MSALDVVLSQKQIIVALSVALLPFVIAIVLNVWAAMKRASAERAVYRQQVMLAQQVAMQQQAAALAQQQAEAEVQAHEAVAQPAAQPMTGAAQPKAGAAAQSVPGPAAPAVTSPAEPITSDHAPEPEVVEAESGEESDDDAPGGDEAVSSTMQALLSDVFGDDDAAVQYENLLRGFEDVSTTDLISLGQQLMDSFQQRQAGSK